MNAKLDLEKFRKQLLEEKERLIREHRAAGMHNSEEGYELADYDNHPADAASETFERTKDYAIDENYRDMLERINEALRKIDDNTYGICDRCGIEINPNRLKAIPYATLCIDCQEAIERR